jgi:hypothetical protein
MNSEPKEPVSIKSNTEECALLQEELFKCYRLKDTCDDKLKQYILKCGKYKPYRDKILHWAIFSTH